MGVGLSGQLRGCEIGGCWAPCGECGTGVALDGGTGVVRASGCGMVWSGLGVGVDDGWWMVRLRMWDLVWYAGWWNGLVP